MRGWVVGLIAAALLIAAVGVGLIAVVASGDQTAIVDLDVGDCFDLPSDGATVRTIEQVDVIDCGTPHLAEVVADGLLNADGELPYPSDEELFADIEQVCRTTGAVDSADFGLLPIAPTPELWESFDGRFLCVAIPFGGEHVTGSIVAD